MVGTHALIEEHVEFLKLALAIVDEQHRFGVAQRVELRQKGCRSSTDDERDADSADLSMSYYADLDVSVIDELPPGRTAGDDKLVAERGATKSSDGSAPPAWPGGQAYWVCPLIEESEKLQLQTAMATHAERPQPIPN